MLYDKYPYSYEDYKREFARVALINNNENVRFSTKKSWLPRKCYLSGKKLWMKESVKLVRTVPTTAARIKETYWIDHREYVLAILRYKR